MTFANMKLSASQVLTEWFALINEFSDEEEMGDSGDHAAWINDLRRITVTNLRNATNSVISMEHRIATVFNPRLKHLPVICTEKERYSYRSCF